MSISRIFALITLAVVAAPAALPQVATGTLPAVVSAAPDTFLQPSATGTVDLSTVFGLPSVAAGDTIVQIQTVLGTINIELFNQTAPLNCANFLNFVNTGAYNNTLIQRSVPGFILQGGGYTIAPPNNLSAVKPNGTVKNEFKISNTAGTMAMALAGSDANSASTNWFFNLVDNSSYLDNTNSGGGPFTVFARVLGTGMTVLNAVAALPTYDLSSVTNADFQTTPLMNVNTTTGIVYANWIRIPSMTVIPVYPPDATTTSVLSFTATSSNPSAVAATVTGHTLTLKAGTSGGSTITLTAADTNGNQVTSRFTAGVIGPPSITTEPVGQTVTAGATVAFSVGATGFPTPTYQWYLNNAPISGATGSRLLLSGATAVAGSYTVTATNSTSSVTSTPAVLGVSSTANPGRLVNLSMLSNISGSLSMGFVIGGGAGGNEPLLIRAIGPSIGPGTVFNVGGVMIDPTLVVVQQTDNTKKFTNAGWGTPSSNQQAVTAADSATGAFGLTVTTSLDSALVQSLPPVGGGYSATVTGASGDSGNALTEVYDATSNYTTASTRLLNLSCLTNISAGNTIDVGFVIGGTTAKTVFIRASGPAIGPGTLFNVGGVMADPQIVVSASATPNAVIASNAGWGGDAVLTAVGNSLGAFAYTNVNSKDSATVVTLEPGVPYAVQVNSASGGGGTVLVEIYEVP